MLKYKLKVIDIKKETDNTVSYYLEKPVELNWAEGAHTHIAIPGFDQGDVPNKSLIRHMSINTLPKDNKIGITTRLVEPLSDFKKELIKIGIGDELVIFKIGSRIPLRRENRPLVLLSMGVGIATMRPLIHAFLDDSSNISCLRNITIDSSKSNIFRDELDPLQRDIYKNEWCTSREEFYERLKDLSQLKNPIYYIIGSDSFITDLIHYLRLQNVKDEDIILDKKDETIKDFFNNIKL